MDNQETMGTLGSKTQDEDKQNKKHNTENKKEQHEPNQ